MPHLTKPDPYCGFKNDRERRLALNVQAVANAISRSITALCSAVAGVSLVLLSPDANEKVEWLLMHYWFH